MSWTGVKSGLLTEALVKALKAHLFPAHAGEQGMDTFAILDGASVPDLLDHLYANPRPEFVCLYRGELEPDMAEVAPYLVRLEPEARFTDWLLAEGWGGHWGVFARTRMDLKAVRKHLRGFLMVLTPESKQVYFRYYDPRVLTAFLPTCDACQIDRVFGPVTSYLCEGGDPAEIIQHRFDGKQLTAERTALATAPHAPESQNPSTVSKLESAAGPRGSGVFMKMRSEQMDALAAPRRAQLPRKIMRYLRGQYSREVQQTTDPELESFVRNAIQRAAGLGIVIEWDLCRYCWLAALHGPEFADEIGWARNILESEDLTPTERVDLLEHYQRNYHEPMFHSR